MNGKMKKLAGKIPVVILAGGQGTRVGSSEIIPKPMVKINGSPLLFYIIDHYRKAGFRKFIICAGSSSRMIQDAIPRSQRDIKVVDTGIENMTGSRLVQVRKHVEEAPFFCCTYGDTVSGIDLQDLLSFHIGHQKTASLVAVHAPTRFRILGLYGDDDLLRGFTEKPVLEKDFINGGFYVFNKTIFNLKTLKKNKDCVLETDVLENLIAKKDICAFRYTGFWQYVDTERDRKKLSAWVSGRGVSYATCC